jgi:catechol 2,3-dioxygenase-like lactoylglutathione lyase family enzyme
MLDHLGLRVKDLARSKTFYTAALAPLGYQIVMEVTPEMGAAYEGVGFGVPPKPDFWIGRGAPNGPVHVAFVAANRKTVDAFYAAAMKTGGRDHGAPGLRAHYHPHYYGAFVLDPDDNNVEVVCHK